MPHRVTCPHCATALRIEHGASLAVVTCPRCLRDVPNPGEPESGMAAPGTKGKGHQADGVKGQVEHDSFWITWGLLALPTFLGAGLIAYGLAFRTGTDEIGLTPTVAGPLNFMAMLCGLGLLTLFSVGALLSRTINRQGLSGCVHGLVLTAGALLAVAAAIVVFVGVCAVVAEGL